MKDESNTRPLILISALADLIALILIILKVANILDWSWLAVTSPFWGQFVLLVAGWVIVMIAAVVIGFFRGGGR